MKNLANIELHVTRAGPAKRTPARTFTDAFAGLSYAMKDITVTDVEVTEQRTFTSIVTGETFKRPVTVVSFQRSGPQEFATGSRPWWEGRSREQAR